MNTSFKNSIVTKFIFFITSIILSTSLFAQAGTSIFTYGKVQLLSSTGDLNDLNRGMDIFSGDTVVTGINGRAQIRMQDGAIFDLKPSTEFLIEEYVYNANSNAVSDEINAKQEKGFYRLVRGGFRSISGLIGKRNKKNYRVKTPVATIGIRGTDYEASLCEQNCGANGTGLYLSVASGGVVMTNAVGTVDIDAGQSGFVSNPNTAPISLSSANSAAASSESDSDPVVVPKEGTDEQGDIISLESGESDQAVVIIKEPTGIPGQVAASVAGDLQSASGAAANLELNDSNVINGFSTEDSSYSRGTATGSNQGHDASTGLYWGRWSNGTASNTNTSNSEVSNVDLNDSHAHLIYTTNEITPTLPTRGTAEFTLVGNTNPTDNLGNSGVLGSASMSADFTNQTVDAAVNLAINNQTWDANANDVALNGEAATFAGEFDQVNITDQETGSIIEGSGELDGFLTGDENGDVAGAGFAYSLSDNDDTTVEGAAAFEVE